MVKKLTKLIVVDSDGVVITCANGLVSIEDPERVRTVKREALLGTPLQLVVPFGDWVNASLDPENLVGLTAALFSARPGRTRLLEAPAEVWDFFEEEFETSEPDSFDDSNPEEYEAILTQLRDFRPIEEKTEGEE